ncbi:hypothetical protein D3C76_1341800 [compost metagenome]
MLDGANELPSLDHCADKLVPAQCNALMSQDHVHDEVVIICMKNGRAVGRTLIDINVQKRQPHPPVHMLSHARPSIGT